MSFQVISVHGGVPAWGSANIRCKLPITIDADGPLSIVIQTLPTDLNLVDGQGNDVHATWTPFPLARVNLYTKGDTFAKYNMTPSRSVVQTVDVDGVEMSVSFPVYDLPTLPSGISYDFANLDVTFKTLREAFTVNGAPPSTPYYYMKSDPTTVISDINMVFRAYVGPRGAMPPAPPSLPPSAVSRLAMRLSSAEKWGIGGGLGLLLIIVVGFIVWRYYYRNSV